MACLSAIVASQSLFSVHIEGYPIEISNAIECKTWEQTRRPHQVLKALIRRITSDSMKQRYLLVEAWIPAPSVNSNCCPETKTETRNSEFAAPSICLHKSDIALIRCNSAEPSPWNYKKESDCHLAHMRRRMLCNIAQHCFRNPKFHQAPDITRSCHSICDGQ